MQCQVMFGEPDPEQLKPFYQQTDCWCRIYHINTIYKVCTIKYTKGEKVCPVSQAHQKTF